MDETSQTKSQTLPGNRTMNDQMIEVIRISQAEHRKILEICQNRGVTFQDLVLGLLRTKIHEAAIPHKDNTCNDCIAKIEKEKRKIWDEMSEIWREVADIWREVEILQKS